MKNSFIYPEDIPVEYGDFYEKLSNTPDGIYQCSKDGILDFNTPGWIGVSRKSENDKIELLWTSHEHYHVRHYSSHKAVAADFFEDKVGYIMQAAFRMWPVKDQEDRAAVVLFLINRMNNAIANMDQKPDESLFKKILVWIKKLFTIKQSKS